MNLLPDREEFVLDHRSHGPLAAEATDPVFDGCLLTVANNVLLDAINRGISEASLLSAIRKLGVISTDDVQKAGTDGLSELCQSRHVVCPPDRRQTSRSGHHGLVNCVHDPQPRRSD